MIRRLLAAIFIVGALLGVASATPGSITIDDDYGGNIETYSNWWKRVAASEIPVHFHGMCISACTLGLMLPSSQMCADPTATFGFHMASDETDGPDIEFTKALVVRFYPPAIQAWLQGKTFPHNRPIFLSADKVIKMGVMSACPPINNT